MSLYHIYSDLTSLGLKTSSICFSKTPLHLLLPCWKGIHSVHHSSDKESSFSPLSKYTWNEGCSCSDRCSCSSSSKLFISQVLLCIFWALSTEGWINVPNSPRVEGSTAGRMGLESLQLSHHSRNTDREPKECPCSTHRSPRAPCPRDEPGQARTAPGRGSKIPGLGSEETLGFLSPPALPRILK